MLRPKCVIASTRNPFAREQTRTLFDSTVSESPAIRIRHAIKCRNKGMRIERISKAAGLCAGQSRRRPTVNFASEDTAPSLQFVIRRNREIDYVGDANHYHSPLTDVYLGILRVKCPRHNTTYSYTFVLPGAFAGSIDSTSRIH